jgi:hypothetical protein
MSTVAKEFNINGRGDAGQDFREHVRAFSATKPVQNCRIIANGSNIIKIFGLNYCKL